MSHFHSFASPNEFSQPTQVNFFQASSNASFPSSSSSLKRSRDSTDSLSTPLSDSSMFCDSSVGKRFRPPSSVDPTLLHQKINSSAFLNNSSHHASAHQQHEEWLKNNQRSASQEYQQAYETAAVSNERSNFLLVRSLSQPTSFSHSELIARQNEMKRLFLKSGVQREKFSEHN